ncbi:HXXEE domain-containing protein [Spiractinospora alimapuensis]|uniref:HXXEE domain-containing protein n=1 Tax=Spiractinospora alimapuensis TaxID=2820884 RepID=UPI001F3E5A23|nr:HXXEE domain-containing protein [Spiractinospora alimapuensis]QVQ53758.1 HXXEE domain-containing protein [Spiractinospora alimapuensis]
MTTRKSNLPWTVTWGLLAAWVVHDVEELATMARFTQRDDVPLPELDQAHVNTAIGLMAGVVTAASAAGARTGGRSPFFQTVLVGFGLHSLTHVAQAVALRRYTPGLVTAPLVVAPYSYWAWRQLRKRNLPTRTSAASFAWFPVVAGGVHLAAAAITKARERRDT